MGSPEPSLIRAYTRTEGRTATDVPLPLEAVIGIAPQAAPMRWQPGDLRGDIVALGQLPLSVAEVAARLQLPLGVARVLIGDLVASGQIRVQSTLGDLTTTQSRRDLIERTLLGLRAL